MYSNAAYIKSIYQQMKRKGSWPGHIDSLQEISVKQWHHLIRRGQINYLLKDSVLFHLRFTQTPSSNHPCNSSIKVHPQSVPTGFILGP